MTATPLRAVSAKGLTVFLLTWLLVATQVSSAVVSDVSPSEETDCFTAFDEFDARWLTADRYGNVVSLLPYQQVATLCPAGCLAAARGRGSAALVWGSYPYHGSSSLCLSAVHAGVINDSAGGGVFVSYFHRHEWSDSKRQTIFPFTSAAGSFSNAVRSANVSTSWFNVLSNRTERSYTVRGRGELVVQRRQAPFSARAGTCISDGACTTARSPWWTPSTR
jgi:hypothetical protein